MTHLRICRIFAGFFTSTIVITAFLFAFVSIPLPAEASAPSLQVAPLQYEDTLTPGQTKNGFVDVANPTDTDLHIAANLQAFRQVGHDGAIEFYDDPDLASAITIGLTDFTLGPREAVRVTFTVNAAKLSAGTTTATLFFTTKAADQASNSSYINMQARIGTHLILTNATTATPQGHFNNVHMPFWQFGAALTGSYSLENTDRSSHPLAIRPQVSLVVLPWSKSHPQTTGLVTGGIARTFSINQRGAYLGLLSITLTDATTHAKATAWVFAVTGYWRWLAPLLLVTIIILLLPARWFGLKPRTKITIPKCPIDGLGPKV